MSIITIYYFCGKRDGTEGLKHYYHITVVLLLYYVPSVLLLETRDSEVDMAVQACNPNTWEAGAEDPKFSANLDNTMSSQPA